MRWWLNLDLSGWTNFSLGFKIKLHIFPTSKLTKKINRKTFEVKTYTLKVHEFCQLWISPRLFTPPSSFYPISPRKVSPMCISPGSPKKLGAEYFFPFLCIFTTLCFITICPNIFIVGTPVSQTTPYFRICSIFFWFFIFSPLFSPFLKVCVCSLQEGNIFVDWVCREFENWE